MQFKAYRERKAISQSSLKVLEYDPKSFYRDTERWLIGEIPTQPEYKETQSMLLGSVVDSLALTPDRFTRNYIVARNAPTGQMLDFTDTYVKLEREAKGMEVTLDKDQVQKIAQQAYEIVGFKKDSFAKVLERFKTEAIDYYNTHLKAAERAVIAPQMYDRAQRLVMALRANKLISALLWDREEEREWKSCPQVDLYNSYGPDNIEVKGLIDFMGVDHKAKTVQVVDLKTTSDDYFGSAILNYRYDLQAAFYTGLVSRWMEQQDIGEYTLLPFRFVVANTTNFKTEMWQLSEHDLNVGMEGGTTHYGRRVKGLKELLNAYRWHKATNNWDYTRDVYEQGAIITNLFRP